MLHLLAGLCVVVIIIVTVTILLYAGWCWLNQSGGRE